tara:strand:- start:695 stop:1696 length:1002 start_codon:yes stop_codon:yes gene_type:complete
MEKGVERIVLEHGDYETDLNFIHVDGRGIYSVDKPVQGTNPAITVYSENLPSGWELAMIAAWDYGARVGTHYDPTEDTPKSKEGTIIVKVSNPFNEPRIHKNFPGGPTELESYRQEVVNGIHNHWIDPKNGKWTYTYNERLTDYNPSINLNAEDRGLLLEKGVDQIEKVIEDLERDITSKGAQATTWMPTADPGLESNRACLQRLWFRPLPIDPDDLSKGYFLNVNSHWRSRDLGKAWFMNAYAITDWQRNIAERLQEKIGVPFLVGSYTDISDSLHIYGAYFKKLGPEFDKMRDDDLTKRVWESTHPAFEFMTQEAKEKLAKDVDYYKDGGD